MRDPKGPGGRTDRAITPTGRQAVIETEEKTERPVTQILQDILTNVQEIVRSEVRLAKAEISEETAKALRAMTVLGVGVFLSMYAVGFLLLSAVFALAGVLPAWLAPLLVGLIVGIVATVLIVTGRSRLMDVKPVPDKTIESVKEDVKWVKDQTK